jgi:hypothetical protein
VRLRKTAGVAVAVTSILAAVIASATPALAAPVAPAAPPLAAPAVSGLGASAHSMAVPAVFSLWRDPDFAGPGGSFADHAINYDGLVYPGTNILIDDTASSAANFDTTIGVRAYTLRNRGGFAIQFLRRPQVTGFNSWFYNQAQLSNHGGVSFDNAISSHHFFE